MNLGVSNFQRAMSMVIPRSRSAFSLSSTHAGEIRYDQTFHSPELKFSLTILERTLSEFSGFLFKFLDGTLIDTTALVDQVTSSGRLAGVDVADD